MAITAAALNRATLARQLLLRREPLGAADAVRRVVALQAQEAASPYLALWNRLTDFDPADLDDAFASHQVVRATLMRITMHAIHVADFRAFREAMEPTLRGSRLGDDRFTSSGLTAADADALLAPLLRYANRPRTAADMAAWLAAQRGAPMDPTAWRLLRQYLPFWHAPTGKPWSFTTRQAYVAPHTRPALADPGAPDAGLPTLVLRYLAGFGPASVADVAQFTLVPRLRVRAAVDALGAELQRLDGPDGAVLYDVPDGPRLAADTPAPPRLMAMWDSILLAYADRARVIPPDYRRLVTRNNGDVLPTLLVDGYVAGVWRPADGGIEATAFHRLPDDVWRALAGEARSLLAFVGGRDPDVYRRYHHWWRKTLPSAETRLLPGD